MTENQGLRIVYGEPDAETECLTLEEEVENPAADSGLIENLSDRQK